MEAIKEILKAIFKILWKMFLIALWGISKIGETVFEQLAKLLKDAIDKKG
ncbi:MAG TPA: hypothetical protein VK808_02405 [Bacteroidia bacterium]|nr:hypothetical protein [Bacteroidia bacterium]